MSSTVQVGRLRSKHTRPNSAVYIGSDPFQLQQIGSTPPSLPDLPEPPSPVSSTGSGLPSPPATNSTGSGSTGDPASIALRGVTKGNMPLLEEKHIKTFHAAFEQQQQQRPQGQHHYETVDDDDDIDNHTNNSNEFYAHDDDTAKFSRSKNNTSNDNALALERVKSLQERNRMVLNKLSSRLSTPSPNPSSQARSKDTISRIDSSSSHSSSSSSSRPSLARNHRHSYQPDTNTQTTSSSARQDLSGSETERESVRDGGNTYYEEDDDNESGSPSSILLNHTATFSRPISAKTPGRPTTPSHPMFNSNSHLSPRSIRTRLISAPASPGKALSSISRSTSGSGSGQTGSQSPLSSPGRPRKRASMGLPSMSYSVDPRGHDQEDVTSAALAAVANSRRGLGGGGGSVSAGRKRQPLPREFWEGSSVSGGSGVGMSRRASLSSNGHADEANEVDSLLHERKISSRASLSRHQPLQLQTEPRPSAATLTQGGRRKLYNGHNNSYRRTSGAWASEDLGNRSSGFGVEDESLPSPAGRRQTVRHGGSADSVLTIGAGQRSLIGEGLKAAGISRRGDGGSARSPVFEREQDREREERIERIRSQSRASSRAGHGRAVTAMAEYSNVYDDADDVPEPQTHLRPYKSAYPLTGRDREMDDRDRDGDRVPSSLSQYRLERDRGPPSATSAASHSIISTRRFNTISSSVTDMSRNTEGTLDGVPSSRSRTGGAVDRSDHTRLLNSSLDLFENALSKIPSSSSSSSASNTSDLVRNARVIVGAVEKLNELLKVGHGRALNAQIDCEVQTAGGGGSGNAEEIWRLVGGEYREGLRVSDDLVRAVTDFLLGVGRAVKDMGIVPEGESSVNGDNLHTRSVSLDEIGVGRMGRVSLSPDATGGSGGARSTGTGSAHSRRSWEPTPGRDTEALRRLAGGPRPETSLGVSSNERHQTSFNRTTRRVPTSNENGKQGSVRRMPTPNENGIQGSVRRMLTPREMREQQLVRDEDVPGAMSTFDSQETLHALAYDPSPTPASRAAPRVKQIAQERNPHPPPDRSKTMPALSIPPPLPALPSENWRTPSSSNKGTPALNTSTLSRRRTPQAPLSTVRGPTFPLTTPNVPTTAVTTTHVSGSPQQRTFPLVRENSNTSSASGGPRSSVTFSRSSTTSALSGLQQQQQRAEQQRNRTLSNSSDVRDNSFDHHNELVDSASHAPTGTSKGKVVAAAGRLQRVISAGGGSETEKDVHRKSGGTVRENHSRTPKISFDESSFSVGVNRNEASSSSSAHPADRAAVSTVSHGKRERRKTVADMWPRGGS